jgi:hypothetical protein
MNTPQQLLTIGFISAMCMERAQAAVVVADALDTELHPDLRDVVEELRANADVFYVIAAHFNAQNTTRAKQPPMVERFEEMMRQKQSLAHGAAAAAIKGSNGR